MTAQRYRLNGRDYRHTGEPDRSLLDILREDHGLIAAKPGCGIGRCGACLVLMDDAPVNACLVPAYRLDGADIVSAEGLDALAEGEPVREALIAENAFQCGYCAPGFTVALVALLRASPGADEAAIRAALSGNLCRCTGYSSILRGAREAASRLSARPAAPTGPAPPPKPPMEHRPTPHQLRSGTFAWGPIRTITDLACSKEVVPPLPGQT